MTYLSSLRPQAFSKHLLGFGVETCLAYAIFEVALLAVRSIRSRSLKAVVVVAAVICY